MAKREYLQELIDLRKYVVAELRSLITDEIDVTEKYIYAVRTTQFGVDEVKINRVRNDNGNLNFECVSLSDNKTYNHRTDELNVTGLTTLLDNILVDDCEPERYEWC